jgi:hypothetical protein
MIGENVNSTLPNIRMIDMEKDCYHSMFKFFPAELWQVASNVTSQGLWVGHREGM